MKICIKCGNAKDYSEFSRHSKTSDGLQATCKCCQKEYGKYYTKTINGVISRIYGDQRKASKHRGHPMPSYSKIELRHWLLSQPKFHKIYKNWIKSNYDKWEKPSCDRIKNNLPYTFDNLQLMTWRENNKRSHVDMINCDIIHTANPQRAVIKMRLNGSFVSEYRSIMEAERQTGIANADICAVCIKRKGHHTAGGFKWKYKN